MEIARVPLWAIAVRFLFFYTAQALACSRWNLLLTLNGISLKFWAALHLHFLGVFTSCFLPGSVGGDAIKIAALAKQKQGRTGRIIATTVLDRLLGTFSILVVALCVLPRLCHWIDLKSLATHVSIYYIAACVVVISALVFWLLYQNAWKWKQTEFGKKLIEGFGRVRLLAHEWRQHPMVFAQGFLVSLITLLTSTLGAYAILVGMNVEISYMDFLSVTLIMYFINLLPITVNGLGVTEVSSVVLLGLFGVSSEQALAFAVLGRCLFLISVAPFALFRHPKSAAAHTPDVDSVSETERSDQSEKR